MTRKLMALGLMFISGWACAQSNPYSYQNTNVLRGTVFSAGRVDPTENIGTGYFIDINYSSVALNGGVASKKFGSLPGTSILDVDCAECTADGRRVNNAYFGVGFSRWIQFQYGYGTEGDLTRLRSDFNFRGIVDFLTQTPTPRIACCWPTGSPSPLPWKTIRTRNPKALTTSPGASGCCSDVC